MRIQKVRRPYRRLKPIVIGPPDYVVVSCGDCKEKFWTKKDDKGPYRCNNCDAKEILNAAKRKRYHRRYLEARKKLLARNPDWPKRLKPRRKGPCYP